jgi:hypothetical protein
LPPSQEAVRWSFPGERILDAAKMPKRDISIGQEMFDANYSNAGSYLADVYGRSRLQSDEFATNIGH